MTYIPQKKSCNMQLNVGHINRIIGKDYAYVTSIISWSLKNIILNYLSRRMENVLL